MASTNNQSLASAHTALARVLDVDISTKQSVEISRALRYKKTAFARAFLEEVMVLKKAVPFRKFDQDLGHKSGMSGGRFPQKAAAKFLILIKEVEANAQAKGLDTSALKIIKLVANKAAIPHTGSRWHPGTRRTSIEIMVREAKPRKESKKENKNQKDETNKQTSSKEKAPLKGSA